MWKNMFELMEGSFAALTKAQQATLAAATRSMALSAYAYTRLWGRPAEAVMERDRRFKADSWQENIGADVLSQSYLITSRWMQDVADSFEDVDKDLHLRVRFWTRQVADAISPSNNPMLNPEVVQETVRTGGQNFVRGMRRMITDLQNGRIAQVPEDAFAVGRDLAITPGKVVFRNELIEVMQYEPATEKVYPVPMLMIPPWINKYYVMDMAPANSMYKYLVDSGFTVFTISWKNPDKSILHLEWDDYMELGPLTALDVVKDITGAEKVNLVGYCLGGIALQVILAYLAALDEDSVANTATFFTTHQDFADIGDIGAFISEPEADFLDWLMEMNGGYLDGRNLASTFNMLRANDLFWRFVINNYMMGKEPPPFGLLYWNSDGTRIPGKVHSFLVREFFVHNKLKEPGGIKIKGVDIDVRKIKTPSYAVTAANDHIVPWRGAYMIRSLMGGPVRFVLSQGGHIAGVINPPGRKKIRSHWINDAEVSDPDEWLAGATEHKKSWWRDWIPWLRRRSGRKVNPPSMGSESHPPIMDAPGLYVLES